MNILLLLTEIGSKISWHQGLASIGTYLRHNGYPGTDLLELLRMDFGEVDRKIKQFDPTIIAAAANSHQVPHVSKIFDYVSKKYPHIRLIMGGYHATLWPEVIHEVPGLHGIILGEGEGPMLQYAQAVENGNNDFSEVESLWYKLGDSIIKNPKTYYVKNLDDLPPLDRTLFSRFRETGPKKLLPFRVRFLFCRGCPFNCTYCCNKAFKDAFAGGVKNYLRWPSPQRAVDEIVYTVDHWNFKEFVIDDDIFTFNKKWVTEFCEKYPKHLKDKVSFECNIRVGCIDKELMQSLKDIGCSLLKFGVESGDELIRKNVLQRNMSDEVIIETYQMAREVGIGAHSFNIIGIPGERKEHVWKTIKMNRIIKPERVQVTVFYPYLGTELGNYCYDEEDMVGETLDSYYLDTQLDETLRDLSDGELKFFIRYFKLLVYMSYSWEKTWEELISIFKTSALMKPYWKARSLFQRAHRKFWKERKIPIYDGSQFSFE